MPWHCNILMSCLQLNLASYHWFDSTRNHQSLFLYVSQIRVVGFVTLFEKGTSMRPITVIFVINRIMCLICADGMKCLQYYKFTVMTCMVSLSC